MSTIIYPSPIFGPVHSRRLGISLGINLLPADGKVSTVSIVSVVSTRTIAPPCPCRSVRRWHRNWRQSFRKCRLKGSCPTC